MPEYADNTAHGASLSGYSRWTFVFLTNSAGGDKKAEVAGFFPFIQIPAQHKGSKEQILSGSFIHRLPKKSPSFIISHPDEEKSYKIPWSRRFADRESSRDMIRLLTRPKKSTNDYSRLNRADSRYLAAIEAIIVPGSHRNQIRYTQLTGSLANVS
jgi:hypothetical protein